MTTKHYDDLKSCREQELNDKGWSRYDVLYVGIDQTVIPLLGSAMKASAHHAPTMNKDKDTIVSYGDSLYSLRLHEKTWTRETQEYEKLFSTCHRALQWLSDNPQYALAMKTRNGSTVLSLIGESMKYLSNNCVLYPEYGQYSASDGGITRWKSDCAMFGESLTTTDTQRVSEALHWVSIWYGFLWT